MRYYKQILITLTAGAFLFLQCSPLYQNSRLQYAGYPISGERIDTSMYNWLRPYSDSLAKSMNTYIATLAQDLEKQQPEGTLGNLMADALLAMAEQQYGRRPDAAFMNNGGIRLPVLKAGPVTRGKVYELFPFDNILVLVEIKGTVLQQFLDHIAGRGGWPVAGMTMNIRKGRAVDVRIGGRELDPTATYTIAMGDYTANGGDDAAMLVGLPQQNNGYLMRDAILAYMRGLAAAGSIRMQLEKRVQYVD